MNAFERQVRAAVIQTLRDTGEAPTAAAIGDMLGATESSVSGALSSLADEHRLGTLQTHSPATGEPITLAVRDGVVEGDAIVHFPVPARQLWDDIVFT